MRKYYHSACQLIKWTQERESQAESINMQIISSKRKIDKHNDGEGLPILNNKNGEKS